jgi:hypothetical protein
MATHQDYNSITVGELRRHLELFDDDCDLMFGTDGRLTFYRVKSRGEKLVQIEFAEFVPQLKDDEQPEVE